MTMFLDTFHVAHSSPSLQFIQYDGPPKPKQPTQRTPFKALVNKGRARDNAEMENKGDVAPSLGGDELNDFTYLTEEGDCELSGSRDGGSGDPRQKTEDEASHQPSLSDGGSQENAIVVEDSQSDSDAEEGDPCYSDPGLPLNDRLEGPHPNLEHCSMESFTGTNNATTSETGDGATTEAMEGSHWRPSSTPPTSPSMRSIKQSAQETSFSVRAQAITHQPQRPIEKRTESEVHLPTSESTSSSSSSGSDCNDDNDGGSDIQSVIRKRKRPSPAKNANDKRQRQSLDIHSAGRRKPGCPRENPVPSRLTNTRLALGAQSSGCEHSSDESSGGGDDRGRHRREAPSSKVGGHASLSCSSRSNAENPSSLASSHARWRTKRSTEYISPEKPRWCLSDITFHSLPAYVSFVTALFHAGSSAGTLSPRYAVQLLENAIGQAMKLEDVTIKLLTQDTWFLTGLVEYASDVAGLEPEEAISALSSLRLDRADVALARQHGRPSDDSDDETSNDDYDMNRNGGGRTFERRH